MSTRFPARRVALVAASESILGGHSVQARELSQGLRADGVAVDWIAIDRVFPRPIRRLRRVKGLRTVINELLYARALTALARADVAHVFSAAYWSFLLSPMPAMLFGRACGCRVILHYHSGEVADHLDCWGWRVHPWLRLPHEIVVCSRYQHDAFAKHGYRATIVPNVVDLSRFAFRERRPIAPRFICTRNLERIYGIDVVIDAFALIRHRFPSASLVIAGAGAEERALRARVQDRDVGGVVFAGAIPPAAMPQLLDRADIYLNASTVDNQPVSLLEAQASGLAIVTTGTGAIPEIVEDGRTGMIVTAGDAAGLAAAACALLEAPHQTIEMIRLAHARLDRFSWRAVGPAWARIYATNRNLDVPADVIPPVQGART